MDRGLGGPQATGSQELDTTEYSQAKQILPLDGTGSATVAKFWETQTACDCGRNS